MTDTANYYTIITKWTKKTPASPGYKSGFTLAHLLAHDPESLDSLLEEENISPQYFDLTIYKNWADSALAVANLGIVSAFAVVALEDRSVCYSLALYETKESEEEMQLSNPEIFEKLNSSKTEFANLMELDVEVKQGAKDLTDDQFFSIAVREITFDEVDALFKDILLK